MELVIGNKFGKLRNELQIKYNQFIADLHDTLK